MKDESHGIHGKKNYQSIKILFIESQSELHSSVCLDALLTSTIKAWFTKAVQSCTGDFMDYSYILYWSSYYIYHIIIILNNINKYEMDPYLSHDLCTL